MGRYLNPGNDGFQESLRSMIYVDKTGLIVHTNHFLCTKQKFICMSRPRRFGKSMTLEMLAAYYGRGLNSRELFQGLQIEEDSTFEEHLNQYDVIYLDMSKFLVSAKEQGMIEYLEQRVLGEFRKAYGMLLKEENAGLVDALGRVYEETGQKFIFLIDEWDCVMRERQKAEGLQKQYLDFLRCLLKDQSYVALAYMTGILPIKKYGVHSALNMFTEYSMIGQRMLEEYTGFTEDEVRGLCARFDMDFEETSNWYDGYQLRKFRHVYNPKSVVEAMLSQEYSNYWNQTETYTALKRYIDLDFDGLRADIIHMLGGGRVKVDTGSFQNDMWTFQVKDDVLTLLIHLGYLAYDSIEKEVFIPNNEIMEEFKNAVRVGGWEEIAAILNTSEQLLQDTLNGREERVAEALDKAHTTVASALTYNREDSLACAILIAYFSARKDYKIIRELPTGYGFADIVFHPLPYRNKPAIIVELKHGKSADAAVRQIKDRNYVQAYEGAEGEVLLVGINYNKKDNKHSCKIEKISVNAVST